MFAHRLREDIKVDLNANFMIGRQHLLAIYNGWVQIVHQRELIMNHRLNSPVLCHLWFRGHSLRLELDFIGLLKVLKHPLFVHTGHTSEVIYTSSSSARPISSTIVSTSFLDAIASPAPTIYAD